MNTRNKIIISLDQLGVGPAMLVIGAFDPLLVAHAERLSELASPDGVKLVVAITDAPGSVLEPSARQEMLAALAVVDFVLPYTPGIETAFPWTGIHDDTALHARWSAEFKEHVRRRSQV